MCSGACRQRSISWIAFFALYHFGQGAVPFTLARIGVSGQLKSFHIVRLQFDGASKFFKGTFVVPFSEIVKTTKRDVLRHD
jgi:hypothetical protein